jgi:predicted nucleotidyltransferase
MTRSVVKVVGGKAVYNGRPLAAWVPDVVERIFERTEATRVVVFGSVQRGDDGPDSDIDVLVVLPTITRRHDDAVAVLRQLRDLPVPVDVMVVNDATVDREAHVPGLVRVALREGWVMMRPGVARS